MEHLGYFVEVSETEVRFQIEKPEPKVVRYWGDGLDKKTIEPAKVIPDGKIDTKELLIKVEQCRTKEALRELWDSNSAYQDYPFMFGHQSTKIKYNDFDHS
jgi:hypothetical protein